MKKLNHVGKKISRYQYDITVHSISNLPKDVSGFLYVKISRGQKKSFATKDKKSTSQGFCEWEESWGLKATLYKKKSSATFDSKLYQFSVKQVKKKGSKNIGSILVDLADFANPTGAGAVRQLLIEKGPAKGSLLKVTFKTQWLRDYKGTKSDAGSVSSLSSGNTQVDNDDSEWSGMESEGHLSDSQTGTYSRRASLEKLSEEENESEDSTSNGDPEADEQSLLGGHGHRRSSRPSTEKLTTKDEFKTGSSSSSRHAGALREDDMRVLVEQTITGPDVPKCFLHHTPESAVILFRCLEYEVKSGRTPPERFVQSITTAIDEVVAKSQFDNEYVAFWLTNSCLLHHLVKKELPASCAAEPPQDQFRSSFSSSRKSKDRRSRRNSPELPTPTNCLDDTTLSNILNALSECCNRVYRSFLNNIFFQLSPMLSSALLEQSLRDHLIFAAPKKRKKKEKGTKTRAATPSSSLSPDSVVAILDQVLAHLSRNHVLPTVVHQVFAQVVAFMDAFLFNILLQQRDLCTARNAFSIKYNLVAIEDWFLKHRNDIPLAPPKGKDNSKNQPIQSSVMRLFYVKEAANVLLLTKTALLDREVRSAACPHISIPQLQHLLRQFQPDELMTELVPEHVLQQLRMESASSAASLQVDPYNRQPLSLSKLDPGTIDLSAVRIPEELLKHPSFQFLNQPYTQSSLS